MVATRECDILLNPREEANSFPLMPPPNELAPHEDAHILEEDIDDVEYSDDAELVC